MLIKKMTERYGIYVVTAMIARQSRHMAILLHRQHCHLERFWLSDGPKVPKKN